MNHYGTVMSFVYTNAVSSFDGVTPTQHLFYIYFIHVCFFYTDIFLLDSLIGGAR